MEHVNKKLLLDLTLYVEFKQKVKELEDKLDELNKAIKNEFKEEGTYTVENFAITLSKSQRESFDLKRALDTNNETFKETLKQFIKQSAVTSLKVNEIKKVAV